MATIDEQLHPAADVLRSRLLVEVDEENLRLEAEIDKSSEQQLVDYLGGIEIQLALGHSVPASLNDAFVVNNFNGLPCLCAPLDASPWHLVEFSSGEVWISGQCAGKFPGECVVSSVREDGAVRLKVLFSQCSAVEGEIRGLDDEDLKRLNEATQEGRDRAISVFLASEGGGLRNPDRILFVPKTLFFLMTEDLAETIRVLGPLPTYKRVEDLHLEPFPGDCVEGPPPSFADESCLAIANAFGCNDCPLLEKNRGLKLLRHRQSKIEERIRSVELHHDLQQTSLSLHDGECIETLESGSMWRMSLKHRDLDGRHLPIVANNLHLLELTVSGIRCGMKSLEMRINEETGLRCFKGTFGNNNTIVGYFDSVSCPEMSDDGAFIERARGYLSGEQQFPPSFTHSGWLSESPAGDCVQHFSRPSIECLGR